MKKSITTLVVSAILVTGAFAPLIASDSAYGTGRGNKGDRNRMAPVRGNIVTADRAAMKFDFKSGTAVTTVHWDRNTKISGGDIAADWVAEVVLSKRDGKTFAASVKLLSKK